MIIDCEQPNLDQAQIISYEEMPIFVNEELILADSFSFNNSNNLVSSYAIGKSKKIRTAASAPIQTTLNLTYYPSWKDSIYQLIRKFEKVKVKLGGIEIDNGYITRFEINVTTNELTKCSAQISFFDLPEKQINKLTIPSTRVFIKQEEASAEPNLAHGNYSKLTQDIVKIPIVYRYRYEAEVNPLVKLGSTKADEIRFGKRVAGCDIQSEELSKFVTLDGEDAEIKLTLHDACGGFPHQRQHLEYVKHYFTNDNVYLCKGEISSLNVDGQISDFIKGNLSIIEFI